MKRDILYDVVVIRLILIVLLVLYHSFAIYNGALISLLGSYWLPWVAFVITLLLSVVLSWGLLKTKVGRFLIG